MPSKADIIADMTHQAASAKPELAALLDDVRLRVLRVEGAADWLTRELGRLYSELLDATLPLLFDGAPDPNIRAGQLGLNTATIAALLYELGADDLVLGLSERMDSLTQLALDGLRRNGVEHEVSVTGLRTALGGFDSEWLHDTFVQPAAEDLMSAYISGITGESIEGARDRLQATMDTTLAHAKTEARTQIAAFDRAVVARTAKESGVSTYIYLGPVDGIMRPFCAALIDHVFTLDQIGRLNNSQTSTHPIYSGGGYNCRHQWQPVSEHMVDVAGLKRGTDEMIQRANEAGRR